MWFLRKQCRNFVENDEITFGGNINLKTDPFDFSGSFIVHCGLKHSTRWYVVLSMSYVYVSRILAYPVLQQSKINHIMTSSGIRGENATEQARCQRFMIDAYSVKSISGRFLSLQLPYRPNGNRSRRFFPFFMVNWEPSTHLLWIDPYISENSMRWYEA